jgi:hypothetical protein
MSVANQRLIPVLADSDDHHSLALIDPKRFFHCVFHTPIIPSVSSKVNPSLDTKYYFAKVVVTHCHART